MSIKDLALHGLPFNRKERYFTGTVFPMLVCADNFAHFARLTDLVGLGRIDIDARPDSTNIQFFTEYGFAESVMGGVKERFPRAPARKDTPDVLVYVSGPRRVLLAIEAKVYDRPSTVELREQLAAQATLLRYLAEKLGVAAADVAHVALLPEKLATTRSGLGVKIVTWEQVLEAYRDVAPPYYVGVLQVALDMYDTLAAPEGSGRNAERKLAGSEILKRHRGGTLDIGWMGRNGGLDGPQLAEDLATGGWRTFRYEFSSQPVDNRNWFEVAAFIARAEKT